MPNNKVELELGTGQAQSAIQAMQAEADRLLATLKEIASSLGSGAAGDPTFQSTARSYAAAQGAVTAASAVSGTASTIGAGGGAAAISAAMVSGAKQGAAAFGQVPQGMGPAAAIAAAQAAGAGVQYTAPFNPTAFVAGVVASTAMSAGPGNGFAMNQVGPFNRAAANSTGFYINGMPALAPPGVSPTDSGLMGGTINPILAGAALASSASIAKTLARGALTSQMRTDLARTGTPFAMAAWDAGQSTLDISYRMAREGGSVSIMEAEIGSSFRVGGQLLGGGIGGFFGPWGAVGGAYLGGQAAEGVGKWMYGGDLAKLDASMAQVPVERSLGRGGWTRAISRSIRFESMNRTLAQSNQFAPGAAALGQTWASVSEGMIAGGIDPHLNAGTAMYGPDSAYVEMWNRTRETLSRGPSMSGNIRALAGIGSMAIMGMGFGPEQIGEFYTRRIATQFGKLAPEIGKDLAPVFGTLPETGGNMADMLMRFGPLNTTRFDLITRGWENRQPWGDLMYTSATVRGQARQAELGGMAVRGSGSAMEAAYRSQMNTVAGLPGGEQSLTFAEARTHARSAAMLGFEQMSAVEFGVPAARLEAARAISMVSPYGPGNRFGIEMLAIGNAQSQLSRVRAFMSDRRARGELSEEDELSLTQQEASLAVQIAHSMATISEGVADRLPSLAAGRPGGFVRADSATLASLNFARIGHPRRSVGAVSGAQLRMQDDFVRGMGSTPGDVSPFSRYSGVNNPRVEALLERIANAIEKGQMGSTPRPGELRGAVASSLSGKQVNPSADRGW